MAKQTIQTDRQTHTQTDRQTSPPVNELCEPDVGNTCGVLPQQVHMRVEDGRVHRLVVLTQYWT